MPQSYRGGVYVRRAGVGMYIYLYKDRSRKKKKLNSKDMLAFQLLGGAKGEKKRNPFHLVLLFSFFSLLLCSWHRYVLQFLFFSFA
jgi:hypothetical protein